jgi:dihydroneopterin aldolase
MNPRSGRARRAIEVYPHPATVALFRLGRTLKYKNKPGRDREALRGELKILMNLIEGLAVRIAEAILADYSVAAVDVTVHKPKAPIEVPFGDVTVSVHRERS